MTAAFPGEGHDTATPVLGDRRPRRGVPARLLRLASDERLVDHVRAGSEPAFEALFDRHHRGVLGFCRHMLGSVEEAEDAVQHTFLSAYRELVATDKPVQLRPWLYTIARNRCLTMLRGRRRMATAEAEDPPTEHLDAEVERRVELRWLLRDVAGLPEDQRAALVLSELGDMSHDEIAAVLGCRREKVKALVFQARSSLIASRTARETPCAEIREQLANLRGGSLRRNELRRHLSECSGCREFRAQVRAQRRDLAMVLPVAPTVGLKSAVLGGGAAVAGGGGAAAVAAKVLVVAAVAAGGGTVAVEVERSHEQAPNQSRNAPPGAAAPAVTSHSGQTPAATTPSRAEPPVVSGGMQDPAGHGPLRPRHASKHVTPALRAPSGPGHGAAPAAKLKPERGHGKATAPGQVKKNAPPAAEAPPAASAKPGKAVQPRKAPRTETAPKPQQAPKAGKAPAAKPPKAESNAAKPSKPANPVKPESSTMLEPTTPPTAETPPATASNPGKGHKTPPAGPAIAP